ncbi:vitamin K epoxide reductase family protein [Rubrivirga sp. IMCC45206]|uniref:vitamin K epoxide reductase family protein n=1 Tax=Rubrivirga sp. IMCC45206 TaxID=3391614 RepID=UPI00398F8E76
MALPAQTSLLRKLLLGVALLGIVVVTHLALQKANGFAAGCTGLGGVDYSAGAAVTGEGSGCATVTEGEYADFLGIPNVTLGLLFYVLIAGLRLAYIAVRDDRLRLASFGVVGVGAAYTAYLVYLQAAVIGSFCALCMTSAAIVLTLLVLHVLEHRRMPSDAPAPADVPRRRRATEPTGLALFRPYLPVLGGFVVLLLGAFALAARTAPDDGPSSALASASGDTPTVPTPRIQDVTGECTYDPEYDPIADLSAFTTGPYLGSADAPVTVVKVFDPNCPHCRDLSETLDGVIAENGEAAKFYYVPFPLRQQSLGQVVALKMAQQEGKFFDLMHEMFERQDATWGMTLPELVATVNAVGMDGAAFEAALNDDAQLQVYLTDIQAQADAVTGAFAREDGGISVPKLAVNGRVVASTFASYSERCLGQFIAEAE